MDQYHGPVIMRPPHPPPPTKSGKNSGRKFLIVASSSVVPLFYTRHAKRSESILSLIVLLDMSQIEDVTKSRNRNFTEQRTERSYVMGNSGVEAAGPLADRWRWRAGLRHCAAARCAHCLATPASPLPFGAGPRGQGIRRLRSVLVSPDWWCVVLLHWPSK